MYVYVCVALIARNGAISKINSMRIDTAAVRRLHRPWGKGQDEGGVTFNDAIT